VTTADITTSLKNKAHELGFQLAACCPAVTPAGLHHLTHWLSEGYAGTMQYIQDRQDAYVHPTHVLQDVQSLLVLAMHYGEGDVVTPIPGKGRVARYAWGSTDYHDLIHKRIKQLKQYHQELLPTQQCRAPILEREFAQLAGLGWVGKNTMLIHSEQGSYFFLTILLSTAELEYDQPSNTSHCGTCTACLDQCPTDAFPTPYVLDATKCISYLTIEHRGSIPDELKQKMGDWVFGCDICQDVCPWNRRGPQQSEPAFVANERLNCLDIEQLFQSTEDSFRATYRHTPLWRTKRDGLLRNAAIALGNQLAVDHLDILKDALQVESPTVQDACRWAIAKIESAIT
jgi:epoxyqueuosine reductase